MKKRYALAGASGRVYGAYAKPIYEKYSRVAELAGIFDVNRGRSEIVSKNCGGAPVFDDFDNMIKTAKPDAVIVTTVDAYHSDYIIRSMELGCDVIVEKPLTTDAQKCKAIVGAVNKYGKKLTVIFNMRYVPFAGKIRELISGGAIGDVYSVHFEYLLDRVMPFDAHGASYFRRWNGRMDKSGGLLLHKASHHFDFINWVIGAAPKKVAAFGKLNLYGKNGRFRGENCRSCAHGGECQFYYGLSEFERGFYAEQEKYDGYYKDGCVFSEDIDIYDTMSLSVLYDGGQMMSYSLNATTAYEGWRLAINGSAGRLEAFAPHTGYQSKNHYKTVKVFDLNDNVTEYNVAELSGAHGGSDDMMLDALFGGAGAQNDPLRRAAGLEAGVNAVLIGAAANLSIKNGDIIDVDSLLR